MTRVVASALLVVALGAARGWAARDVRVVAIESVFAAADTTPPPGDPGVAIPAPPAAWDTLRVLPAPDDSIAARRAHSTAEELDPEEMWLRPPFGDALLTDADQWRSGGKRVFRSRVLLDYNRVDPLRVGGAVQVQPLDRWVPRLGARIEYAFGRDRVLYGAQVEQPLDPSKRVAMGVSMVRNTGHSDLQQTEDVENSLALLFGRTDWRDYFEREGFGAYLSWRIPDLSTASVHLRRDRYRSLPRHPDARSIFFQGRPLRDNPAIDDGDAVTSTVRLERLALRTRRTRAGLYHWIEWEHAGGALGGDFDYTRTLADVRSIVRLSPATTLALRGVAGHGAGADLPAQKQFTVGGVDGLRAHRFAEYRGDEMLLGQAEYLVSLWRLRSSGVVSGLQVIAFVDAGRAWAGRFDPKRQVFQADGGVGLGTSEDGLRVYFARDLRESGGGFVISARLQRPF